VKKNEASYNVFVLGTSPPQPFDLDQMLFRFLGNPLKQDYAVEGWKWVLVFGTVGESSELLGFWTYSIVPYSRN
jgi:hypothetical protein